MKAEKMSRIAALGCLLCGRPSELHHLRAGMGMGQRNTDENVIGLCPYHHRTGPFGEAIHNGYKTFCKKYGSEATLLAKLNKILRERNDEMDTDSDTTDDGRLRGT